MYLKIAFWLFYMIQSACSEAAVHRWSADCLYLLHSGPIALKVESYYLKSRFVGQCDECLFTESSLCCTLRRGWYRAYAR